MRFNLFFVFFPFVFVFFIWRSIILEFSFEIIRHLDRIVFRRNFIFLIFFIFIWSIFNLLMKLSQQHFYCSSKHDIKFLESRSPINNNFNRMRTGILYCKFYSKENQKTFQKRVHSLKTFHLTVIGKNRQNELRVIRSCLHKENESYWLKKAANQE